MGRAIAIGLAGLVVLEGLVALAGEGTDTGPPVFTRLGDAVGFIAKCLEAEDWPRLAAACVGKRRPDEHVLKALAEVHRTTPLPQLYAGREFPAEGDRFKLGGHAKELGHIHIDFVKRDERWCLEAIWMCR